MKKRLDFAKSVRLFINMGIFILLSSALPRCKKDSSDNSSHNKPVADFSFTITAQGVLPVKVNFKSESKGATDFSWDFGNGKTGKGQSAVGEFSSAGKYMVKLVVANAVGKDSIQKEISIVQDKPIVSFSYTLLNDGEMPCKVKFTGNVTGGETFKWYFGDGDSSSDTNPEKTYSASTHFSVKLIAANGAGKDSAVQEIKINPVLYSVRVLLITPRDVVFNPLYYSAIKSCVLNLQSWYKTQMGGRTFVLNNPVVDTITGLHDSAWYNADNGAISGADPRFYGWYNTFAEMQQLYGADFNLSRYANLVYVAAPGGGAGSTGFAALGDQDLKGLIGTNPDMPTLGRVIGGSGHELGHAFGLPHPDNQNPQALMWTGYTIYPDCILQDADKIILNGSLFFK